MKKHKTLFYLFFVPVFFCVLKACLSGDPAIMAFQSYYPPRLADGWEIAMPADVNIDGEKLIDVYRHAHESGSFWQLRSLLVFKDNKLIAESYMKDQDDRTNPGAVWSCTKQVTAILTGIAVDNNYISITDCISDYLPLTSEQEAEKSRITIENLLMMKSGINFNNNGVFGDVAALLREKPQDLLRFVLNLNMHSSPGTQFRYKEGDPIIISAIIQEKTGKTMRDWAKEVLFDKIGINELHWYTYKDGMTIGGFGILTTPRELAKIGQLVLNDGMWGTERIVSSTWLAEMTSSKVSEDEIQMAGISFGYYWWIDAGRNLSIMAGHGGQYVFINKPKNLMVVMTSEPNTQGKFNFSISQGVSIYDRIYDIITD